MPSRNRSGNIVDTAQNAARDYFDASQRMLTLVERLADAHAKLMQLGRQRDELLLSAVTAWPDLEPRDQQRLHLLLRVVSHPAAENLLASIRKQHPPGTAAEHRVPKTPSEDRS